VIQFGNLFGATTTGATRATLGVGNTLNRAQYAGTVDDAYFNSVNGSGSYYVCGNGTSSAPLATTMTLYKITVTAGALGAKTAGPAVSLTAATGDCSPISELVNSSVEYLYFSVPDHADDGATVVCGGLVTSSCLYLMNLSNLSAVAESWRLDVANQFTAGDNVTINGTSTTAGTTWSLGSNKNQAVTNLANYINANSATIGMTATFATGGSANVIVTATTVGDKADGGFTESGAQSNWVKVLNGSTGGSNVWNANSTANAGLFVTGGTTGLIMDNIDTTQTGRSQIYFMNLTQPGNAVQASQQGLQ
jgi:hypothetical protein